MANVEEKKDNTEFVQTIKQNPFFKILFDLLKPLENFKNINYTNYTTKHYEFSTKFENKLKKLSNKKTKNEIRKSFEKIPAELLLNSFIELQKEAEKEFAKSDQKNKKFKLLNELIITADKKYKFVSFLILNKIDYYTIGKCCAITSDLFEKINVSKGEYRANLTIRAFREIAEMLYDNYLRILYDFVRIVHGKNKNFKSKTHDSSEMSFGGLIAQLKEYENRFKSLNELVDFDAGWIRNACSHNHWEYIPKTDSLLLWDRKVKPCSIKVNALLRKINKMYDLSAITLPKIREIYVLKNSWFNSFVDLFQDYGKNWKENLNNPEINKQFVLKMKKLFN